MSIICRKFAETSEQNDNIFQFQSDNQDNEKSNYDIDNHGNDNATREYVSSPGYDTSSTHPPSSPDLCEYTYEGAIQDYKSRVSRAQKCNFYSDNYPKDSNHESNGQAPRKQTSAEIENRLSNFEAKTSNDAEKSENLIKKNLPKVDIARRRELFEKDKVTLEKQDTEKAINNLVNDFSQSMSIKERLMNLESRNDTQESSNTKVDCLNTEFGSVKDRLLDIENASIHQNVQPEKHTPIDVAITSLKDRLSHLHEIVPSNASENVTTNNLVTSNEVKCDDDQATKINNENMNNNNNSQEAESMEETVADVEESKISEEVKATENVELVEQPTPVPDVIQEQPNRLLSTINEAIHLVEDQPENIVKRDASVSSPNLFDNHVLDDIVVDNQVIDDVDDTSNTNLKSYMVMDSTSDNIVHNSLTDDTTTTTGNQVLTTAGETLCISSNATISDCCRQQSINDDILNKVDVMCLRSPIDESKTLNELEIELNSNVLVVETVELVLPSNGEVKSNFTEENQNSCPLKLETSTTDSVHKNSTTEMKSSDTFIPSESIESSDSSFVHPNRSFESSESKNNRIKCQIVGVLEKHKCPTDTSPSRSDLTLNTTLTVDSLPSPDQPLQSPSKSPYKSKTIFDFIKRNLLNDPLPVAKDDEVHSTFYVPLIDGNESEKKPTNSRCDSETVDDSTEINILIDEELEKLN